MKKFIALAAVVLVSAERARLKAEEQAQDAISYDDAMAALKAHQFVMEADQVMFRNGQTAFVNSNTMTLSGNLVPLEQSNIFKGRSW